MCITKAGVFSNLQQSTPLIAAGGITGTEHVPGELQSEIGVMRTTLQAACVG